MYCYSALYGVVDLLPPSGWLVVVSWHGVATWRWDVNDERCGICYNAFEACCPDCSAPGDDCPPGRATTPYIGHDGSCSGSHCRRISISSRYCCRPSPEELSVMPHLIHPR